MESILFRLKDVSHICLSLFSSPYLGSFCRSTTCQSLNGFTVGHEFKEWGVKPGTPVGLARSPTALSAV